MSSSRTFWAALRGMLTIVSLLVICFLVGWAGWSTVTWVRYGHVIASPPLDPSMTRFIPRYEVVEQHQRDVAASRAAAFRAVQSFRLDDSGIIRSIFRARELMLSQRSADSAFSPPFLQLARQIGWGVIDSVPGRKYVFGAVTQPWQGDVHFRALPPRRFLAFDTAGYAKIVWSIVIDSLSPASSRVTTETRVATTDSVSRDRFRRYWSIYSPGIVLIRREILRVIAERAESAQSPAARR